MNLPQEWMPGLTLIGILGLETGLVALLALLAARRMGSAQWVRTLWQAAVLAMGILVVLECLGVARELGAWAWHSTFPPRIEAAQRTPAAVLVARPLRSEFREGVQARVAARRPSSGAPADESPASWRPARGTARSQGVPLRAEGPEPYLVERSWPWVELVWAIGTVAVLVPGALAHLFFFLFHRRRKACFDGRLHQQIAALAGQMGIRRGVRVFESERLSSPAAFGVLRPSVGLPQGFCGQFSPAQQQVMIAHELAHIRGHDLGWQALADVVAALLWWQPLAWVARGQLRAAAEAAADEASHLVRHGPSVLAECLLRLASGAAPSPSAGSLGATGFRSGLGRRIERLVRLEHREWAPPSRWQVGVSKALIVLGGVAVAILGTAWANPNSEGAPMKILKQTWNRSAATLTLLAAFTTEPGTANAMATPGPNAPPLARFENSGTRPLALTSSDQIVNDAKLLVEMGKLDEAEAKLKMADRSFPSEPREQRIQLAGHIKEMRLAQQQKSPPSPASTSPAPSPAPAAAPAEQAEPEDQDQAATVYRMDPRLLERYGLKGGGRPTAANPARNNRGKQQVENKLNQIVFNDVAYDGLPLSEVIRDIQEQTRKKDPAKQGINFIITGVPEIPIPSGVDPTTGQPVVAQTADLNSVIIRLRLRDVRLKDVLDAITRVSDQPIKYSLEDYGVVISPAAGQTFQPFVQNHVAEPPRLLVRTFRVDTNNFLAGLDTAFGITTAKDGKDARAVQQALRQLLVQLGINLEVTGKAVFYNELTGILMVRGTAEDLDLVQAAIETLGGRVNRVQNARDKAGPADGMSATVMGAVTRPGAIEWSSDQRIDLLEAIARANGFVPTANKNKIELMRNGQKTVYKFSALMKGTTPEERIWLEPGDAIFIPEVFF